MLGTPRLLAAPLSLSLVLGFAAATASLLTPSMTPHAAASTVRHDVTTGPHHASTTRHHKRGARGPAAAAVETFGLSPVFSRTLVGGFDQAGNTLLQCDKLTNGGALPTGGCVTDIQAALTNPGGRPFYNNQVIMRALDRDTNPATQTSSSATVTVPPGAKVVFADLLWLGTSQKDVNPNIVWDPAIFNRPMKLSVGDDKNYQSVSPDRGASIRPGNPANDTNDFYYNASADVTSLVAGKTGQITFWGADAPFPPNALNQASMAWDVVVVYQYDAPDIAAGRVGKKITVQNGFVYQKSDAAATNTVVDVPSVTAPNDIQYGLMAGEGDAGLTGDTFSINGNNITHPVTRQTSNFFVSNARGATDPDWTGNFGTDDLVSTVPTGIVHGGDKSVRLATTTSGDGFMLRELATAIPVPSIGLDKSVPATYTDVGAPLPYTFTVTNTSGVTLHDTSVTDPSLGGTIADCNRLGTLAPGTSYTCTATHTITAADIAAGRIVNTATAHGFGEANERLENDDSAVSTSHSTLLLKKFGAPKPVHAGDPFSYTITVQNLGPADAVDVTVTDPLPAGLVNPTASATNGATASIANGTLTAHKGLLTHGAPSTFDVTVTGTIADPFTGPNPMVNTATVTAPGTNCDPSSPDPQACKDVDTTTVLLPAPITIAKSTDNPAPKPGQTFAYTVLVTNTSSSVTANAAFSDPIPAPLTGATWTCAATSGSSCGTASGTGDIVSVALTLAPGGEATFTITVTVPGDFQGGTITNTATADPSTHTVCEHNAAAATCDASVPVIVTPDPAPLTISKTHTPNNPNPAPGAAITYTVVVTNPSPSTIAHATFDDPVPAQIDATAATWSTVTTGAGTTATPPQGTGFPIGVTLVIAPRGSVTFTINARVAATFAGQDVTNTATATPGVNTSCANGQRPCIAEDSFQIPARLVVTKTHAPVDPAPAPGEQVTYTVTVTNPSSGATGVGTFSDPLPAELDAATATWTCVAAVLGSSCPPNGTGSPDGVPIAVASNGGTVTFTITATILDSPVAVDILNVGHVVPGAGTECADGRSICDGTDEFTSTPGPATLLISKALSPPAPTPVQRQPVTYTVTVANTSPTSRAAGAVSDLPQTPPLEGLTWTAQASAGSTVAGGPSASGTGPFTAVPVVLAPGGNVTFTVHATVSSTWPGGDVTNTATVTPGENTECDPSAPSCAATTVFPTPSKIVIEKIHLPTDPLPKSGETVFYVFVVTNLSPTQAASATIDDPLPPEVARAGATWTAFTRADGTSATPASGTGPIQGVSVTLSPQSQVVFVIRATILRSFTGGTITNTVTATPGDGTACRSGEPVCTADTSFPTGPEPAGLRIGKAFHPHVASFSPGDTVGFTVILVNTSFGTIAHGVLNDPVPAGLQAVSWTATATAGSTVSPRSGRGRIGNVSVTIRPRGRVVFSISARIDPGFDGSFDITNVATVTPGTNTVCSPSNRPQACNANAVIPITVVLATHVNASSAIPKTGAQVGRIMVVGGLLLLTGLALLAASATTHPRHRQ